MAALVEPNTALENQDAPEWFIILGQSSQDNLMEMITQAVGNYGSLSPDAIKEVITKFGRSVDESKVREIQRYFAIRAAFEAALVAFRGGYDQCEFLDGGNYGMVYKCTDRGQPDRALAVKQINIIEAIKILRRPDMELRDFLRREISYWQAIQDAGPHEGKQYIIELVNVIYTPAVTGHPVGGFPEGIPVSIVMEYAGAGSMDLQRLVAGNRLDEPQAKVIFRQICLALQYIHSIPVMHRDIKAENVLVIPTDPIAVSDHFGNHKMDAKGVPMWVPRNPNDPNAWRVKLIDFGFAKAIHESLAAPPTGGVGSFPAQEVIDHGPYGAPNDCYAMGVTLFYMLHARVFKNMLAGQNGKWIILRKHGVPVQADWRTTISISCRDLISRLVPTNPTERLTMDQVLEHAWFAEH
jgi:serine/threonine protein kinase